MRWDAFGCIPEIELPVLSTPALGYDLDKTWVRVGYRLGIRCCFAGFWRRWAAMFDLKKAERIFIAVGYTDLRQGKSS